MRITLCIKGHHFPTSVLVVNTLSPSFSSSYIAATPTSPGTTMRSLLLLVLLAAAMLASGREHMPCTLNGGITADIVGDRFIFGGGVEFYRAKLFYDELNMRFAVFVNETISPSGGKAEGHLFVEWFDYRGEVPEGFRYFPSNKTCETINPKDKDFPYIRVPAEAQWRRHEYLGLQGVPEESLMADVWVGQKGDYKYIGKWTTRGCVPVAEIFIDTERDSRLSRFTRYYSNIVKGITNPDVFEDLGKLCPA